ncbi:hypothetical protein [Mycolicibacterium sp. XJ870]
MAIEDLTYQLTALKQGGQPDLQLSEAARDDYVNAIKEYRQALVEQRDNVLVLNDLGNAGGYRSAQQTKQELELNAVGLVSIYESLNKYVEYLDELEETVNAAFKRMQAEG